MLLAPAIALALVPSLMLPAPPRAAIFATAEPPPINDEPPTTTVGKELRIDDDQNGAGVVALGAAALVVPLLAFGVATALGMTGGSMDNDGIGAPLTREEVRAMQQRQSNAASADQDDERPLTYEEAAEEQALVDILQGGINRAR